MSTGPEITRLLTAADVALALQIDLRTVRRKIADGRIPVVRLGRLVRIHPADLAKLMKSGDSP